MDVNNIGLVEILNKIYFENWEEVDNMMIIRQNLFEGGRERVLVIEFWSEYRIKKINEKIG